MDQSTRVSHIKWFHGMNDKQGISGVDPKYKETFDAVAIGLTQVDLKGRFIRVNDYLCQFLGYTQEEMVNLTFQELSLPEDLPESMVWIKASLAGEIDHSFSKVKRYKHKNGNLVWAKLTTTLMKDENGQPEYFISSIQDVADLKKAEAALDESLQKLNLAYKELKQLSVRDGLTGALNSNAFRDHLLQEFERFRRHGVVSTLVFIDLDKFKEINDQYGHIAGDEVLKGLVSQLIKESRITDVVARYGGDEFAVLMPDSTAELAQNYCERVGRSMVFEIEDGKTCEVGISFGLCEITNAFDSIDDWLSQADQLMYQDKRDS